VILEIDPQFQRDPQDLTRIYGPGQADTQVPLSDLSSGSLSPCGRGCRASPCERGG